LRLFHASRKERIQSLTECLTIRLLAHGSESLSRVECRLRLRARRGRIELRAFHGWRFRQPDIPGNDGFEHVVAEELPQVGSNQSGEVGPVVEHGQ